MIIFFLYIIIINIITFHLYRLDKWRAEQSEYRISEAILLGVSFLGGALGAFCAMREFRHKTLHSVFAIGVPLALIIQMALVIWVMYYCLLET